MNEDFSRTLSNLMDYYSKNTESDQMTHVKSEIDSVKNIMVDNIDKMLERGERIELLVDKTENLQSNAFRFKKQSTALKRAMWWKNLKLTLVIVFVVLVVIYFIVALICGGLAFQRCVNTAKGAEDQTSGRSGAGELAPAALTVALSLYFTLMG
jgi:vesicle-associated membrane protein 7